MDHLLEEGISNCRCFNLNSAQTQLKSGVALGTLLVPLMFLIYINDIGDKVSSSLWLFCDDYILYRNVTSLIGRLQTTTV